MANVIHGGQESLERTILTALLDEREVAEALHVSLGTIRRWRLFRTGPPFRKIGALVRYERQAVASWLASRPTGGERDSGIK